MKKFIVKATVFSAVIIALNYYFFTIAVQQPVDEFYLRFTGPKATSMIIGSSRAAQALNPDWAFNGLDAGTNPMNFSFTQAHSPFGEVYNHAIFKKLDSSVKNGIFIVEVNPLSFTVKRNASPDSLFPEQHSFLGQLYTFNGSVNAEYLLKSYKKPLYRIFSDKKESALLLHSNGWLEVKFNRDSLKLKKRIILAEKEHREHVFPEATISDERLQSFKELIAGLKKQGTVVLTRLPLSSEMYELEKEFWPDFDRKMEETGEKNGITYLNFTNENNRFLTIDGSHLDRTSSQMVCAEINRFLGNNPR